MQIFSASLTSAHVGGCARRLRQRSSLHAPCVLPSATEPSRRLLHLFEIVCRRQYSTCIAVTSSFPLLTENWTFCPVLQLFCLMSVSLYWLLRDLTLLSCILAVLGLMPHQVNSLASSSSSFLLNISNVILSLFAGTFRDILSLLKANISKFIL